jgi:hypothetical protein
VVCVAPPSKENNLVDLRRSLVSGRAILARYMFTFACDSDDEDVGDTDDAPCHDAKSSDENAAPIQTTPYVEQAACHVVVMPCTTYCPMATVQAQVVK